MASFNGLGMHMGNLAILSDAESRSISAENPTGEKGKGAMATPDPAKSPARKLGRGWKVAPYVVIEPGEVKVLADISGAGAIAQIWMTPTGPWRSSIMRIYWDGSPEPSVECPVGDFFACGWNKIRAGLVAGGMRESRQRVQLLLGNAISQALPDYYDQYCRHGNDTILSNQLCTH